MCDFRDYPKMFDLEGNEIQADHLKCHTTTFDDENMGCLHFDKVEDPGIYFVCATGSNYRYYDGNKWHSCYSSEEYRFEFNEHPIKRWEIHGI